MSKNHKKRNISIEVTKYKNKVYNVEVWKLMKNGLDNSSRILLRKHKNVHRKKFKRLFRKYRNRLVRVLYNEVDLNHVG